jgi:integrase
MIRFDATTRSWLKHHSERIIVVRKKHQRPKVQDLKTKWKIVYWDYSSGKPVKRSKVWAKSLVRSQRAAQSEADSFMEDVNERNNNPVLYSSDENTVAGLHKKCVKLTWPHLKKPTRMNYEYFFLKYLVPAWGHTRLHEMNTMELQAFFNALQPKLSPKTIRNMHAALRAALNQAVAWGMIERNPAIGVKLPRKRAVKPPLVLSFREIRAHLGVLPDPARAIVTLIVFGSMRVGEVLALRWNDILRDRIVIDERLYESELDDPKTEHGKREVPLDRQGTLKDALARTWKKTKHKTPTDFVFCSRNGNTLERRNILKRQIKPKAKALGIPETIDFRSFRTMHSSLMGRAGARPEVIRDNMGHSDIDVSQNIYGRTWWEERVDAVSDAVTLLMTSGNESASTGGEMQGNDDPRAMLFSAVGKSQLEPQLEPQH